MALLHSECNLSPLCQSLFYSLCTVFDGVSSNTEKVLPMNLSASTFVFVYFNVHFKEWLIFSSGTDRPGELCYIFFILHGLIQIVNLPDDIPECHSHSSVLLNLLLSCEPNVYFAMAFTPLGNANSGVVSVSIDFLSNSKGDAKGFLKLPILLILKKGLYHFPET